MSKRNARKGGSVHGRHVDAIGAVLSRALRRRGRGYGSAGILIASRQLSGPNDGGPIEILCGERGSYPPKTELMPLTDDEQTTAEKILADFLDDSSAETWSDLVVVVRLGPGGVAITAMPSPVSRLTEPSAAHRRREFLAAPPIDRIQGLLAMSGSR